jgi:DNA-binding transcriptional regulator LsrR (DeoR family)
MKPSAEKINTLVKVSKLYYLHHLNQSQIANVIHIHRTEISRMLKEAKRLGIVKVYVDTTFGSAKNVAEFFEQAFSLETALVVPDDQTGSYKESLEMLGLYTDSFLHSLIKNNTTIGLSWGQTLAVVADQFQSDVFPKNITVIPLIGGPRGSLPAPYHANSIVHRFASKITDAIPYSLDTPALIRSKELKDELLDNPNVEKVISMWSNLDVAIFGIGSKESSGSKSWQQFYKETSFVSGLGKKAAGDILSQPFTAEGKILKSPNVNIISMSLDQLRKVHRRIGIAAGERKVSGILGALRAGLVTDLVTTYSTALAMKKVISQM